MLYATSRCPLNYQCGAGVVRHQSRRGVRTGTGNSATRVATGIGRLDVVDEQRTSFAQSQSAVIGRFAHHLHSNRRAVDYIIYIIIIYSYYIRSYRSGGGEAICPSLMAVRLAADLRPSADKSAVRTWPSCRQPACL